MTKFKRIYIYSSKRWPTFIIVIIVFLRLLKIPSGAEQSERQVKSGKRMLSGDEAAGCYASDSSLNIHGIPARF
jgi:hypothetical protein